ncbi:MAG: saccharopine dehydrogenase NADP-binding domain-containing protein [Desulfobacterales bacterium]|nr:saccharopine dehydrogenase NADP-binding domain-containing protein [Desulfobacterales bacterium]
MKKVLIMGVGAQGSTVAKRLNEEENVAEIICADYDLKAAENVGKSLSKGKAVQVNARDIQDIVRVAEGVDIIVNGLPIEYNLNVMEAALQVGANYQDLCMTVLEGKGSIESTEYIFTEMHKKFKEKGVLALTNTGSAPGLANVMSREAVDKLDSCDRIEINVYEGVWSKKFVPFWWAPVVAFEDMGENPTRFENGKLVKTTPFANPIMMKFPGIDKEIRMVDHSHEEPITMGINANKCMKGVKDIIFRYGGPHVELSESLYNMGFLSKKEREFNGMKYIPFNLVIDHAPPAPKYEDEIQEIIDGGLISEEGAFQVLVEGKKDGKPVMITCYANAPGLIEAFEKSGLSHESYLTGQCAYIFTKMLVNDVIKQTGAIAPEVLNADERKFFFDEAAKLDITIDETIEYIN